MAKDSNGNDKELENRIKNERYMKTAIHECYASFKSIIMFLVDGPREKE